MPSVKSINTEYVYSFFQQLASSSLNHNQSTSTPLSLFLHVETPSKFYYTTRTGCRMHRIQKSTCSVRSLQSIIAPKMLLPSHHISNCESLLSNTAFLYSGLVQSPFSYPRVPRLVFYGKFRPLSASPEQC